MSSKGVSAMNKVLKTVFKAIEDPRLNRTKKHPLESILLLAFCGSLAGIDNFVGYEDYGKAHRKTLEKLIDFPSGIPSHDTIGRVISLLDVETFDRCFMDFVSQLRRSCEDVISIDGKTMRGSHHHAQGKRSQHIVSAWSHHDSLALGQVKCDEKSNEITAIPSLLAKLDIYNQIITIDAMGCQREICELIKSQEGEYVISLKGNQVSLHNDIKRYFEDETLPISQEWEEYDKCHGRIEHRVCRVVEDIEWLQSEHQWPGLKTIAMVKSTRELIRGAKSTTTEDTRYYISSLGADAEKIAKAARSHWSIENKLHWVLDVSFNEDGSRVRNNNAPEILNMLRKWALNVINQHKGKLSVARAMKRVAMDGQALIDIIEKI